MTKIISIIDLVRSPIKPAGHDDWQKSAYKWSVTLMLRGRFMNVDFYTGSGLPNAPETHEVVSCIAMDSLSAINAKNFEDWAEEFGYDTDSRKAEKTYKKCVKQGLRFTKFIADDFDIETLSYEDECQEYCE